MTCAMGYPPYGRDAVGGSGRSPGSPAPEGQAPIFRTTTPVDATDADEFPEFARARAHLLSLSPERRAELQSQWEGE